MQGNCSGGIRVGRASKLQSALKARGREYIRIAQWHWKIISAVQKDTTTLPYIYTVKMLGTLEVGSCGLANPNLIENLYCMHPLCSSTNSKPDLVVRYVLNPFQRAVIKINQIGCMIVTSVFGRSSSCPTLRTKNGRLAGLD